MTDDNITGDETTSDDNKDRETVEFYDEDEWFIENDTLIYEDVQSALIEQSENVVSWEIRGLYDEDSTIYSRKKLKNEPPVLTISNSENEIVEFVLTKEFLRTFSKALNDSYKASYGVQPEDTKKTLKEKMSITFKEFLQNKILLVFLFLFVLSVGWNLYSMVF